MILIKKEAEEKICPDCGAKMNSFAKEYVCPECRYVVWKKGDELSIAEAVSKGRNL